MFPCEEAKSSNPFWARRFFKKSAVSEWIWDSCEILESAINITDPSRERGRNGACGDQEFPGLHK